MMGGRIDMILLNASTTMILLPSDKKERIINKLGIPSNKKVLFLANFLNFNIIFNQIKKTVEFQL